MQSQLNEWMNYYSPDVLPVHQLSELSLNEFLVRAKPKQAER